MSKNLFKNWRTFLKEQPEKGVETSPGFAGDAKKGYEYARQLASRSHPELGMSPPYHLEGQEMDLKDPKALKIIKVAVKEIAECIDNLSYRYEWIAPFLENPRAIQRDDWGRAIGSGEASSLEKALGKEEDPDRSMMSAVGGQSAYDELQTFYFKETLKAKESGLRIIQQSHYIKPNSKLDACSIAILWEEYHSKRDKYIDRLEKKYVTPPEGYKKAAKYVPIPKDSDFKAAGFVPFNGNDVVEIKSRRPFGTKKEKAAGGRKVNYGQQVMIDFLNSFQSNPELVAYGPWFIEDISRESGGDTVEHGSHEWGLDVDISIPIITQADLEGGYAERNPTQVNPKAVPKRNRKGRLQRINRQKVGKRSTKGPYGKEEAWNFLIVEENEINVDAALALIKHCFSGQYSSGWKVKLILVDDDLRKVIEDGIKSRLKLDPEDPNFDKMLSIKADENMPEQRIRKGSFIFQTVIKKYVRHEDNHKNHFHIRLHAPGNETEQMKVFKQAYSVPGVGKRRAALRDPGDSGETRKGKRLAKVKVRDKKTGKVVIDPRTGKPKYEMKIVDLLIKSKKQYSAAYGPNINMLKVLEMIERVIGADIDI